MTRSFILKKDPIIKIRLLDEDFELIDQLTLQNSGFYAYHTMESIKLKKPWFPALAKWLRIITTILNGVPFFPDAESYKKAMLVIHLKHSTIGFWLTDTKMANAAKIIKQLLEAQKQPLV